MEAGKLNTASLNIYPPHRSLAYCFLHNDTSPLGVGEKAQTAVQHNCMGLQQASGGNENKAVLSEGLKADPQHSRAPEITVESVSSIAACGRSTQPLVRRDWERKTTYHLRVVVPLRREKQDSGVSRNSGEAHCLPSLSVSSLTSFFRLRTFF